MTRLPAASGKSYLPFLPGCVYIYALVDPRDMAIRYIGQSVDPQIRYEAHLEDINSYTEKGQWFRDLAHLRMRPFLVILDLVEKRQAHEREQAWIRYCRYTDCDLLNNRQRGTGIMGDEEDPIQNIRAAYNWRMQTLIMHHFSFKKAFAW